MKAVIYFTEVPQQYEHKNMEHMIGEKLLATGLYKEYGLKLAFEPRATGEHGKPFLTLQPKIHYNITHSGNRLRRSDVLKGSCISYNNKDILPSTGFVVRTF